MEVNTIQSKIEEKAKKELRDDVEKAVDICYGVLNHPKEVQLIVDDKPVMIDIFDVQEAIRTALYNENERVYINYAINSFLKNVENLKEQLDEMTPK